MQTVFGTRPDWVSTLQTSEVPFFAVVLAEHSDSHAVDDRIPWLIFRNGKLRVGDFVVQAPEFRGDSVAWCQTSQRGFTSGHLYYGRGGAELQGFVCVGDSQETAEHLRVIATAVPFGQFNTMISEPGGEPTEGPVLRLGYRPGLGMATRPAILVDDEDVTETALISLEGDAPALRIHLDDRDRWGAFHGLAQLRFRIDAAAEIALDGRITQIGTDEKIRILSIQGELASSEAALMEAPAVPLIYTHADPPSSEAALEADDPLTTEEARGLYAILAKLPDDHALGEQTFKYMQQNMKWAMYQDGSQDEIHSRRVWLNYFKSSEPYIPSESRKAAIRRHLEWYNNTMAVALMAQGFANMAPSPKVVPRPIPSNEKAMIDRYVQKCLAGNEVFHEESEQVWRDLYLEQSAGLEKYVKEDERTRATDKTGDAEAHTWASRVRRYFTTPEQLQFLTTGLYTGAQLKPGDASAKRPRSEEDYDKAIAERKQELADLELRLKGLETAPKGPDALRDTQDLIQAKHEIIELLEDQKQDVALTRNKSTATIKNVSSLLKALDPTGNSAQGYANQTGAAVLAVNAAHSDIDAIPDYGEVLEGHMKTFFEDLAGGRLTIFGAEADEQFAAQVRDLMSQERMDAKSLASKMNRVLSRARGETFMDKANHAAGTFASEYPKLTAVFRIAIIAAYAYTVVRLFQLIGQDPGHQSTYDQVTFYGAVSMLAVETIRSFIPNVKAFLDTTKAFVSNILAKKAEEEALKEVSKGASGRLVQWWGTFTDWIGNLMSLAGAGLARIGSGLRSLVANAADSIVVKWLVDMVKSAFNAITGMVGRVFNSVSGAVSRLATRFADWFKATFPKFSQWVGKALNVVSKGLTIIAVLWSTITEAIACVKLWKSDRQLGAKILTTIGFIATVAGGLATIIGMFSTAFAWSGVGIAIGLIAFGIAVLVSLIWPEDSPVQKLIDQVLRPFIRDKAAPELTLIDQKEQQYTSDIEDHFLSGEGSAAMA